jgi:hypothetical protein
MGERERNRSIDREHFSLALDYPPSPTGYRLSQRPDASSGGGSPLQKSVRVSFIRERFPLRWFFIGQHPDALARRGINCVTQVERGGGVCALSLRRESFMTLVACVSATCFVAYPVDLTLLNPVLRLILETFLDRQFSWPVGT